MMITNKKQAGFSLIEISVVMIISGIILAGLLQAYVVYQEKAQYERAAILMTTLDQTLQSYYAAEGRFPCPAPLNSSSAGNDYDSEDCGTAVGHVAGIGGKQVLIGKIPAATLGLSNDYMRDVYGSYLRYAITEDATVDGGSIAGAIRVREENIDRNPGSSTFGQLTQVQNHTNITYLVISSGKSKIGALLHDGTQVIACSTASVKEQENCNGDATFRASLLSNVDNTSNSNFYDDRVVFKQDDDLSAQTAMLRRAIAGEDYDVTHSGSRNAVLTMKKDGYLQVREYSCPAQGACSVSTSDPNMYVLSNGDTLRLIPSSGGYSQLTLNGQPVSSATTAGGDSFSYATTSYGYDKSPEITGITYAEQHGSGNNEDSFGFATNIWVK